MRRNCASESLRNSPPTSLKVWSGGLVLLWLPIRPPAPGNTKKTPTKIQPSSASVDTPAATWKAVPKGKFSFLGESEERELEGPGVRTQGKHTPTSINEVEQRLLKPCLFPWGDHSKNQKESVLKLCFLFGRGADRVRTVCGKGIVHPPPPLQINMELKIGGSSNGGCHNMISKPTILNHKTAVNRRKFKRSHVPFSLGRPPFRNN